MSNLISKKRFWLDEEEHHFETKYEYQNDLLVSKTEIDYDEKNNYILKKNKDHYKPKITTYEYEFYEN